MGNDINYSTDFKVKIDALTNYLISPNLWMNALNIFLYFWRHQDFNLHALIPCETPYVHLNQLYHKFKFVYKCIWYTLMISLEKLVQFFFFFGIYMLRESRSLC